MESKSENKRGRCVVVGGADISCPARVAAALRPDDFVICCDSGLEHMDVLAAPPSLVVGDFDSYPGPRPDIETITLPVAKDDTDSVFAVKEGMRRGFREFLLLGAVGARLDHTLVNVYILTMLENRGCHGVIIDDYSEMELICGYPAGPEAESAAVITEECKSAAPAGGVCARRAEEEIVVSGCGRKTEAAAASGSENETPDARPGKAFIEDSCPYFSLIALEGPARGVSIRNAKFPLEDAEITPDYQFATSNEVLPGKTAEVEVRDGRLLLIKIAEGAAERHDSRL